MEALRYLASFVSNLKYEDLPQEVRRAAAGCVLDSVSVGVGASSDAQVLAVSEAYLTAFGSEPVCNLWGQGRKAPLASSVFLNAMASHTLELDDVHAASKTHIGTVVVPAVWALAEAMGCSGRQLLAAVVAGYETASRIGMSFGVVGHRKLGWHATGTAGVFGAAAACANLLGLSAEETLNAIALGGAQAFGVWAFLGDGASCKTLNPARAADSGCSAAILAKAGMSGPEHILTASDGGLFALMSKQPTEELVCARLGSVWEILNLDKKPYPCCRSTHCTIDAALALRAAHKISADAIRSVTVETYEVGYDQCGVSAGSLCPQTPGQAKFSTPYTVATALIKGSVSLTDFTPEAVKREDVSDLLRRVKVVPHERFSNAYPEHWGCCVNIELHDGTILSRTVYDASGSIANPQSNEQLKEKAKMLFARALNPADESVIDTLLKLDDEVRLPKL